MNDLYQSSLDCINNDDIKWSYWYNGNNGTNNYSQTLELDKTKSYYILWVPNGGVYSGNTNVTSGAVVSSISEGGSYELLSGSDVIFQLHDVVRLFKIENASSITFTYKLTVNNGGSGFFIAEL